MARTKILMTKAQREWRREERRRAQQSLDDRDAAINAFGTIDPSAFRPGSLAKPIKQLEDFASRITAFRW